MARFVAGMVAMLLALTGGLLWWQSHADSANSAPAPHHLADAPLTLPEGDEDATGAAPPALPESRPQDREARRFARYDKDRNGVISRIEMMATRTNDFRKLDKDGNNLLSFEEWAVRTGDKFADADANHDGKLTPPEFATTAPKPRKARCGC